jgi:hypothetical protein
MKETPGLPKTGRDRARNLQVLFTKLEKISDLDAEKIGAQRLIGEIVEEAYEFSVATDLQAALEQSTLNPSLKKYLQEAISKLGKYFSAVSDLVCAARDRKCRIFHKIHVEAFQIYVPAFIKEVPQELLPSSIPVEIMNLPTGRAEEVKHGLQQRMVEVSESRTVHAEIQLLFFYELYPKSPRPRIICSSKSACYLCNLFFNVHGGFHVPRTHGRLYDTWVLPDWLDVPENRHQDLIAITKQFKATLDDRIKEVLISKPRKYNHPNESALLPAAAPWQSSILSDISIPTVTASTSTLRLQSPLIGEDALSIKSSRDRCLPLMPPKIYPVLSHSAGISNTDPENTIASNNFTENTTSVDAVSVVTVRQSNLPYTRLITLATPSLYVRLDTLSVTLEFIQVLSGRLSITQTEERDEWSKELRVFDVEDIPRTTELQVHCSNNLNELRIWFQRGKKGIINIAFVWGDAP